MVSLLLRQFRPQQDEMLRHSEFQIAVRIDEVLDVRQERLAVDPGGIEAGRDVLVHLAEPVPERRDLAVEIRILLSDPSDLFVGQSQFGDKPSSVF